MFRYTVGTLRCFYFLWICVFSFSFLGQPVQAQTPMQVAGTANKIASSSGDWTASSTWGGTLPANNDRVLIPNGITVTIDAKIPQEFKSVRIANGGTLKFATDVDTELRTEYLFSGMMATLEMGTTSDKVAADKTASLVFAERGGATSSFDPNRFAPGAVLMGTTKMHGADKTSWLTLMVHPSAGATQFVLDAAPNGWRIGDKIVVAGTDPITNASITSTEEIGSDEVVTITNIAGNTITFTPALLRDHEPPAQASDLDVHVANLSRNVVISSENTSISSISGDFRKPRGHIMFMHTLNVDVKYVEANNLGRTDKTLLLDDWDFEELARGANTGSAVPNGGRNPRGRYSFHFHRGGLDESVFPARPITPLPTPARVEGCVVNTDPGWGYVNHSSRVDFVNNVAYNVTGGAFNTEAGNETGSFVENIAIRTINPQNPILTAPRPRDSYTDAEEATLALSDIKEGRQDFAFQGDGFWLHGTGVTVQDNVVAGCTGHAYVYWTDGLIEKGMGMARGDIDAHVPASEFPALNQALKNWKQSYPTFVLDIWYLKSRPFKNNTAYGFARGVQTYYVHTEFHQSTEDASTDPEELFNDLPAVYKDQLDLVLDGTTLWNIGKVGFEHNHTANVTIQNSRIVGYNCRTGYENYGTNPAPNYVSYEPEVIGLDLDFFHNTHRWNLNNNVIEGFAGNSVGIALPINAQVTLDGGIFNNTGTDILVGSPDRHLEEDGFGDAMLSTRSTQSEILLQGNISFQNPNNNIVMDPQLFYHEIDGKGFPMLGEPADDLFFFAPQKITLNFGPFDNSRAYFNEQDGSYKPISSGASGNRCTFGDEAQCVSNQYANKTNTQLKAQYNRSFGGVITPIAAVTHPMILGGKATNVDTTNPCANNGGDADNDGICANKDCDDSDANIGAIQPAGTLCNDGNAATSNDVIQPDGCTCAGTITTSTTFPVDAKILCLGDSRVEGGDDFESYRNALWKDLIDCNWNFDLVGTHEDLLLYPTYQNKTFDPDHQGVGGYTTSDVLQELPDVISSLRTADFVLLGIGGNDLLDGGIAAVPSAINNINAIIDLLQAKNPNVTVLLEQIAPGLSSIMTAELTAAINSFNSQISGIATNQNNSGGHVLAIDMFTGWQDSYLADEVHYNSAGAEVVASRYSDALKALYDCNPITDPCVGVVPVIPTSLTATSNNCNSVTLSWMSTNCVDKYRVQRKVGTGTWMTLSNAITGTNYIDTNPENGTLTYRVRAQNTNGNSGNRKSGIVDCTDNVAQFTLTTGIAGSGNGLIILSPAGGSYEAGTVVTLTAEAGNDSAFENWTGDLTTSDNPATIIMDGPKTVTANFAMTTDEEECEWIVIDSNDFESGWGIWNDGGSDCRRSLHDDEYATSGDYCVRLRDNSNASVMTTESLDLANYESLRISFSYYARSMDKDSEDFWLQISTDGGDSFETIEEWNYEDEFENNETYTTEVLIFDLILTESTELRFRCDASSNSDWVYIDDIEIAACGYDIDGEDDESNDDEGMMAELVNFSFEEPGIDEYEDDFSKIPGWSKGGDGDSGVERGWVAATHGDWICYHEAGDNFIYQTLDLKIEAGQNYLLEFDAIELEDGAEAQVRLRYGNTTIKNLRQELSEDWERYAILFSADDHASAIGENLKIFFRNDGEEDSFAGFDNFSLSFPEDLDAEGGKRTRVDEPLSQDRAVLIYPNPIVQGRDIRIKAPGFSDPSSYVIFDLNGKLIERGRLVGFHKLSTSKLNEGIYFVRVSDCIGAKQTKFVIHKL